ncbi:MAG TPA: CehA/McbA family metallohydrolase [Vicinamibacterales bacterium]|nr:CehA/McbA family metallohydrolase [Vicinamibacterales bacterium]
MRRAAAACALLLVGPAAQPAEPPARTIHRHFNRDDGVTGRYQYVPIDVAAGVESLTVAYRYSGDRTGDSTIDLGLFEPGPLTLGTPGFRGYSGGAQRTITVGRTLASPGYRAGPLPPGTWHVLLGLYKVAPEGVDVDIDVVESRKQQTSSDVAPRHASGDQASVALPAPASAGPRWYSGALHVHTNHSDGTAAPSAVASAARSAGLDFIAITDHNNTTWTREAMPDSPLAIVGEEVTTPGGHASVWGLPGNSWIDFRVLPTDRDAAAAITGLVSHAHRAGALFALNHPFSDCSGCGWQQVIPDALDAVEIWNGQAGPQADAIALWDRLLRAGRHVTAVGTSDWHRPPAPIGDAAVRVLANALSTPLVIGAIRDGRVIVMRDPTTVPPSVTARCGAGGAAIGDTLRCTPGATINVGVGMPDGGDARAALVVNGTHETRARTAGSATFETEAADGYLRVHVIGRDGAIIAITNPIYVSTR